MRDTPCSLQGAQSIAASRMVSIAGAVGLCGPGGGTHELLRDRVRQRERGRTTGWGSEADRAGTPKVFMLAVQQIKRSVSGATHTAKFLNNALTQRAQIGHCTDFGGETSDQVQEICRGGRR